VLNTLFLNLQGMLGGVLSLITQGMLSIVETLKTPRRSTGSSRKAKKDYSKYIRDNKKANAIRAALLTEADIL